MAHIHHNNHQKQFYTKHAQSVSNILQSENNKRTVEEIFESINWDRVRAGVLAGPRNQSSEIQKAGFQSKREAVNNVIEEMEGILNYSYRAGNRLYLNPPVRKIERGYRKNLSEDAFHH